MRIVTTAIALALAGTPMAAGAALKQGAKAPDFTTMGALGGKAFRLNLKQQLRRGPVVLYFFPKAFTQGCTLEAHAFSEAADDFKKLGAQVVGMSADDQPTLAKFSVEECRSSFPVATATPATITAYDVKLKEGSTLTNRTSYVIAPNGTVIYSYSSGDWKNHVPLALGAVRDWKATHGRGKR